MANPAAVRTVVDTDGAGTALAIAALLASLVSFGVVLMSFLQEIGGPMGQATVTLNQANFEKTVLQAKVPVLVDFWAEWCGPCRMISPLLEQIANDHAGKLVVGKVNVDQEQALASKYGIQSIPAFFIFKNGLVTDQFVGAQHSRQSIEAKLGV